MDKDLSSEIAAKLKTGGSVDEQCLPRWQSDAKHLEELVTKLAAIGRWTVLKEEQTGHDYEGMETALANPQSVHNLLKQCAIRTGKGG